MRCMKTAKILMLIQARVSSTRLPGKVLLPFYKGESILELILKRLRGELAEIPIMLATSDQPADDAIVRCCERLEVPVFRGDETDVLKRFIDATAGTAFEGVIRICCDNPFLLTAPVKTLLTQAEQNGAADYISFRDSHFTPAIKTHWGLFAEYVKIKALVEASRRTNDPLYHEHVTNFIYGHPEHFQVKLIPAPAEIIDRNDLRFTVDTPEDFEVARQLFQLLGGRNMGFKLKELVLLVDANPDLKVKMQSGIQNFKK